MNNTSTNSDDNKNTTTNNNNNGNNLITIKLTSISLKRVCRLNRWDPHFFAWRPLRCAGTVMAKDLAKMLPDVGPTSGPIPEEALVPLVPRFDHKYPVPGCDSGCC